MNNSIFIRFHKPAKKTIKFPLIVILAITKNELHIISFYFHRHIIKLLGLYKFRNENVKNIATKLDSIAIKSIGDDHDTYSGATAAEIASGFDYCVEILLKNKKHLSYLEIGSAKGKSMALIGMLSQSYNASFKGISIDPYFEDAYNEGADQPERFLLNAGVYSAPINSQSREQAFSLWEQVNIEVDQIRQTSSKGLNTLFNKNIKFDLVYIDGLHDGLTPIVDFVNVINLTNDGSIIILDDRHWTNVHHLRKICDNTIGLEKIFENWKISAYQVKDHLKLVS